MSFCQVRDWEEEVANPFPPRLGGGNPGGIPEICLARLAGDERNVGAGNAQVGQFAVRQAIQFADRLALTAPVAVIADDVHLFVPRLVWPFAFVRPLSGR